MNELDVMILVASRLAERLVDVPISPTTAKVLAESSWQVVKACMTVLEREGGKSVADLGRTL